MKKLFFISRVCFILSIFYLVCFLFILSAYSADNKVTEIEVMNPYFLSIFTEIKCDWSGELKRYMYHDWITIKSKRKTTISVPHGLKKCELWSQIKWD